MFDKKLTEQCDELQAENERLKGNEKLESENIVLNSLIEMKNDTIKNQMKAFDMLESQFKTAKAEAYKEFWNSRPERLNEQCEGKEEYNKGWNACLDEFWDIRNNLLKELVGEDK